jgi:transposase
MNKIGTLAANGKGENIPTVIGIDLAKNVFALHAVNRHGKPVLVRPQIRRDQLLELLAQLPPCIICMEACSDAHHWAREMIALGHTPKLMAPDS